jgi:hypothetical protein
VHYDASLGRLALGFVRGEADRTRRGRLLEDLVGYLFWTSGEYSVRGSTRGLDAETDLRVRATAPANPPHSDLGTYLLIECKNTLTVTSAPVVKKFATDVRLAGCRCGVLVTLKGVSGSRRNRDARYTIRKLYHADGIVIIVIDDGLLTEIVEQQFSLVDALRSGYEAVRFDYPIS